MAKNKADSLEADFKSLIERMHDCGDLRILRGYIVLLKNECKARRYDPLIIESKQLLTSVNGEEQSYDHLLDEMTAILED